MDARGYEALLRPLVAGRRVVLAGGPAAGHTAAAVLVRRLGADAVLVVGTEGRGAGPLPEAEVARWVAVSSGPVRSVSAGVHAANRLLVDPPPAVLAALADFDPDRTALVIGWFLNEASELDGRPFLAHRRPSWVALEDKLVSDALWDRAGVRRAPSSVVRLDPSAVRRAVGSLDAGAGTVWSADTSSGFHGGGDGTFWVRTSADADAAVEALRGRARRVRVMPYLEGVPCSVQGIVFEDHVAVLRPVEQVTFRPARGAGFVYAGCATFYDPPRAVRAEQGEIARRVGAVLRHEVAYRGAFSIDGVVTSGGFLPTELNPRAGAGVHVLAGSVPGLPLQLLLDALVGGVRLRYRPADLERLLVQGADRTRGGGTWRPVAGAAVTVEHARTPLALDEGGWRWAGPGEPAAGWLQAAESAQGPFVRLSADPHAVPAGPPFAPTAARFWEFADRELRAGAGPLVPACSPVAQP